MLARASIDLPDTSFRDNRTALHKAAAGGHTNIIQLLIEFGADATILDAAGKTYLQILSERELVDLSVTTSIAQHQNETDDNITRGINFEARDIDSESQLASRANGESLNRCGICNSVDLAFSLLRGILVCQKCSKACKIHY